MLIGLATEMTIGNNSGVLLTLKNSGALTITSQGGNPITLYSPVLPTKKNVVVTLLDSGNLVLGEYDDSGSMKHAMWQSFDHPSDVLLPGMKLGVNHKTNRSWSVASSFSTNNPSSDIKKWIKIGALVGTALLIISLGIFCLRMKRRKDAHQEKRSKMGNDTLNLVVSDTFNNLVELQNEVNNGNALRIFSYASIIAATNKFSIDNKLGEGGFGPVYKGLLPQGEEIAIKRLSEDFGMARIFTQESDINTKRIVGTYGYMSPEYAMEGIFSFESDVYAFGVLLLEIISGRKNNTAEGPLNLVGHAWELWKQGHALDLLDPTLIESFIQNEVLRCIHVGLLCVEECAADRPNISEMIPMLNSEIATFPLPRRPAFYRGKKLVEEYDSFIDNEIHSVNGLTISNIGGR
ncbi:Cysteine-rich receptor-like protein kinase 6 [Glycine max]|nr:Cysteine-rich receptor-like protein kinase 6 [Glycine max]